MGVTPARSRLDVPKALPKFECKLLCAELEANVFSVGVASEMGGKAKSGSSTLSRRGHSAADGWIPLVRTSQDLPYRPHCHVARIALPRVHVPGFSLGVTGVGRQG